MTERPRFGVIGAGMSGILAGIQLGEAGFDYQIFEKADRVGGTWRENTYPGIACDVPSHVYSYSFELNPDWSYVSSPGSEIQAYFEGVTRRYGVEQKIRLGDAVTRCTWLSDGWELETAAGHVDRFDYVIAATGILHHPKLPDIEGLESFAGPRFHTARWDHDLELGDERVGVIGNGSSGVQITGALAPRVRHFTLFQRTAQWVMPVKQMAYTQEQRDAFRGDPSLLQRTHDEMQAQFNDGFATAILDRNSELMDQLENICSEHLETAVKDPVLREKLRPSYRAGCKRLVISHEFYDSIQGVNTELVTEPIQRIEAGGVRTVDGRLHELDVLVLATGFQVDRFVRPMRIQGRDGALLDEVWKDRPSAYMALAVPGFPNFFMLNGPNSPVGNFSLIQTAELQFAYVMRLLREARSRGHHVVEPSAEAAQRFEEERTAAAKETVWATGCRSWYLDDRGIPFAWPFPFSRFREEMGEPRVEDYRLE